MSNDKKVIETITSHVNELKKKYGFKTVFLYGSFAKGSASSDSDVDIAVEIIDDSYVTWDNFLGAKEDLNKLLGREIDLVYLGSMNPIIRDEAAKDFIKIE